MKRSEAVDKILYKLWILGVQDLSRDDAESMLEFVEKELHMKPHTGPNTFFMYPSEHEETIMQYKNTVLIWEEE